MRNLSVKSIYAIVVATILVSGCITTKLPEAYKVTPKVLETHGGKCTVQIEGTIPEKSFHKKAIVELQPILKYGDQSINLKPMTLKGEKVLEGDGQTIPAKLGAPVKYNDEFDYNPDMKVAELVVKAKIKVGKKETDVAEVKVADGIIYTSTRIDGDGKLELAQHGYQKEVIVKNGADIFFAYNKSNLEMGLPLNKVAANKAKLDSLESFLKKGWVIKDVVINAWASPEGEETLNQGLSEKRGEVANSYMITLVNKLASAKKSKVKIKKPKEEIKFSVTAKGEDFDGFMRALSASAIKDKKAIENVIKSQATKFEREKSIKDMTVIYKEVEDMLSVLRRSEIVVNSYEPKRTDEKIASLSTTYPDSLTLKELLYAATLTEDKNIQAQVYESATRVYPNEWKGYNNAGVVNVELGKIDEAASLLEKANALEADNGQIINNLGVVEVYRKDFEKAQSYFETAQGSGINEGYNLGIIALFKAEYSNAESAFGTECKYNLALAQLMSQNAEKSLKTLECAEKKASVHYLMAVVGIRTGNNNMVYNNLKKAIQLDPSYREEAKIDREFLDLFNSSEFQNAIK